MSILASPPPSDVCPITQANWAVAHNSRYNYDLVTYGREDFISNVCLRGGDSLFFEEHDSRYIIDLLSKFDEDISSDKTLTGNGLFFSRPWLLDFGTNIGVHTIAAGKAGFGVLGVEANPATAARLSCSIALNKFAHVHLVGAALGGREGPSSVCVEVPNAGNVGTAFVHGGNCAAGQASVPVLVIDDLFRDLPTLPAPAILKMDIEGFELLALRDAEEWLARRSPKIVLIEIHPEWTARAGVHWKDLALFWLNHGYHGWIPQPPGTAQPGPELLKADFINEQAVLSRLANCQYNAYFTLASELPVPLPPRICENH
jgi:FkbM family methyltransferase